MRYRVLGKTGLKVSEIGLGAEWLERHNEAEIKEVVSCCESYGVNILDCWMSEPNVAPILGRQYGESGENGLSKDILAQPGRMASMFAPEILRR